MLETVHVKEAAKNIGEEEAEERTEEVVEK
jgi:hypothetical protein